MSDTQNTPERAKEYQPPAGVSRELTLNVEGQPLPLQYEASAEWLLLRKKDKPLAEVFHVFYRRTDNREPRPLTFVFNGGPGASSAYLHVGGLGPKRVAFQTDGSPLPPPARLVDNQQSWLTFSDLVFVDPVGTGFSRVLDKPEKPTKDSGSDKEEKDTDNQEFYGLKRDLESLAEFISKFLSKHRLWSRPVFIAGESYGGFRVGKLARKLQEGYGVGLNGAILISPALDLRLLQGSDYDVSGWADLFPSLALSAVYHGRSRLFPPGSSLQAVRHEAERFATQDLVMWAVRGEFMPEGERRALQTHMADFLGLPESFLEHREGRLGYRAFARELLRDQRRVCSLYDATATSVDPFPDRETFEGCDAVLGATESMFTSGINVQLRETLGLETERDYCMLNLQVNETWKLDENRHAFESQVGATDDLRYAMALNPHMKVHICHGLYDLVTPYFASERITRQMKLADSQRENLSIRHYRGGHMFYTWEQSRQEFHGEMQSFYAGAVRSS